MCESPHLQCAHGVHEGAGAFEVRRRRTGRALAHLRDPCQHKLRNRAQQPASSSKLAHSNLACSSAGVLTAGGLCCTTSMTHRASSVSNHLRDDARLQVVQDLAQHRAVAQRQSKGQIGGRLHRLPRQLLDPQRSLPPPVRGPVDAQDSS